MVAWLGLSGRAWRRRTTAALGFRVWCDDTKSWSIEVGCIVTGLVGFSVGVGDVPVVARKSRVRAFFHAFAPWFAPKIRRLCFSVARQSAWRRGWLLNWPIEVDADSIPCLARILVGQCEHKWRRIADGGRSTRPLWPTDTSFRLTEIDHVYRERKVRVVRRRVATQQLRYLDDGKNLINTRGN